jgi:hypothetical protein
VVALEPVPDDEVKRLALDGDVLRRLTGPRPCPVSAVRGSRCTPGPAGRAPRRAPRGDRSRHAGQLAAQSPACAERALTLADTGILGTGPVVDSADHLMELWMTGGRFLLDRLCQKVLRPLGTPGRPPGRAARRDADGVAGVPRQQHPHGRAARRAPPDRPLPDGSGPTSCSATSSTTPPRRHEMETVLRADRLLLLPDIDRGWKELREAFPEMPERSTAYVRRRCPGTPARPSV